MRRPLRPVFGEGLRNDAAERVPDDVGSLDPERIHHELDVVGEVEPAIAALRFARLSMTANIHEDQAQALRQIRNQRHPVACVVGIAVNEHYRRTRCIAHVDERQDLPIGQRHGLLACVEGVEIDLKRRRGGG